MLKARDQIPAALRAGSTQIHTVPNQQLGPHPDLKIFVNSPISSCHSFKSLGVLYCSYEW